VSCEPYDEGDGGKKKLTTGPQGSTICWTRGAVSDSNWERSSVCRLELENAFLHLQDGNIKCPAAKIINRNDRVLRTIETVSKGSSCRFADHSEDLKTSNLTSCLMGRRALMQGVYLSLTHTVEESVSGEDLEERVTKRRE
jgi:hypothetical protein